MNLAQLVGAFSKPRTEILACTVCDRPASILGWLSLYRVDDENVDEALAAFELKTESLQGVRQRLQRQAIHVSHYRVAFVESFRRRGIYPLDISTAGIDTIRTLSADTLRSQGFDLSDLSPREYEAVKRQYAGVVDQLKQYADACIYLNDRETLFNQTRTQRRKLHDSLRRGFAATSKFAEGLGIDPKSRFEVHELRPALRMTAAGRRPPYSAGHPFVDSVHCRSEDERHSVAYLPRRFHAGGRSGCGRRALPDPQEHQQQNTARADGCVHAGNCKRSTARSSVRS